MANNGANGDADSQAISFLVSGLQRVLDDIPEVERFSSPEELELTREWLRSMDAFCAKNGPPPGSGPPRKPPFPKASSKFIENALRPFCDGLQAKWPTLGTQNQAHLRLAFAKAFRHIEREQRRLDWPEVAVAGLAVVAWVALFAIGYTVHAKPYEEILMEPGLAPNGWPELGVFIGALFMFAIASIPTNTLLLGGLSGILGTAYRRAKGVNPRRRHSNRARDYMSAITSSFCVFAVLLSGIMVLTVSDALTHETQEKHLQFAGTVSICAFLVGYDRSVVVRILRRAARFLMENEERPNQATQGALKHGASRR